jgi:hypothetical protein
MVAFGIFQRCFSCGDSLLWRAGWSCQEGIEAMSGSRGNQAPAEPICCEVPQGGTRARLPSARHWRWPTFMRAKIQAKAPRRQARI